MVFELPFILPVPSTNIDAVCESTIPQALGTRDVLCTFTLLWSLVGWWFAPTEDCGDDGQAASGEQHAAACHGPLEINRGARSVADEQRSTLPLKNLRCC